MVLGIFYLVFLVFDSLVKLCSKQSVLCSLGKKCMLALKKYTTAGSGGSDKYKLLGIGDEKYGKAKRMEDVF